MHRDLHLEGFLLGKLTKLRMTMPLPTSGTPAGVRALALSSLQPQPTATAKQTSSS